MIEFRDVQSGFGDKVVLQGLSFHVNKGETFVLMGPSGSGKSTTLLHMVGVYRAQEGRVLLQGIDVGRAEPAELHQLRRNIGFLFQSGALLNWLSVFENVALPLREAYQLDEDEIESRVKEALELVRLWEHREKLPAQLSGGMRKRTGLARAIVTRPPILLVDEPTTGLDPGMSHQVDKFIRDLNKRMGTTCVVVTHDILCAQRVADRIGILKDGRIQAEGGADLLETDDPVVMEFLGKTAASGEAR